LVRPLRRRGDRHQVLQPAHGHLRASRVRLHPVSGTGWIGRTAVRYAALMSAFASPILAQLNLVVADMAASVAFYRRLGLTIDDPNPGAPYPNHLRLPRGLSFDL